MAGQGSLDAVPNNSVIDSTSFCVQSLSLSSLFSPALVVFVVLSRFLFFQCLLFLLFSCSSFLITSPFTLLLSSSVPLYSPIQNPPSPLPSPLPGSLVSPLPPLKKKKRSAGLQVLDNTQTSFPVYPVLLLMSGVASEGVGCCVGGTAGASDRRRGEETWQKGKGDGEGGRGAEINVCLYPE